MLAKTMRLPTSSQRIWMRNPSRATTIIMPGGSSNSAWILGTMSTMNDKTSEAGLRSYDKTSEAGLRSYDKTSEAGLRSYGSEGGSGRLLFGVIGGAHHRGGFGRDAGVAFLEAAQQFQRMPVVGARARGLVQARHGFQIVIEHIRRRRT